MFWVKKMHFKILKGYSQLQNPVTQINTLIQYLQA